MAIDRVCHAQKQTGVVSQRISNSKLSLLLGMDLGFRLFNNGLTIKIEVGSVS